VRALAIISASVAVGGSVLAQTPRKSCHPDGKPVEGQVVFNSSGGTYGENVERIFFKRFREECGVQVTQVTDARTYAQMKQFVQSGNVPWDIGGTRTDQEFPLGIKEGLFHKLPDNFWDSLKDELAPGSYSPYGAWATPYADVLVYSTTAFPQGMKTWADFWDVKRFPGPRTMQNSPASLVIALLADGVPADKVYPLDLDRAFRKMDELRAHIRSFWTAGDQPVQGVANGEFVAGTAWNGRVFSAQKSGRPVAASWNGALLRVSWNFILKGSKNTRAAEALLYYMQRPDLQAELATASGYTGGAKGVSKLVDPTLAANLATAPDKVAVASVVDAEWWAANNAAVQARWNAWMAKQ
jgi:putative spermidine/putrescine transport system substrate-binding protein